MKSKKINHSLLFPAYGNIIALVAIGLGILAAFQSVFSWRIIEKELALYLLESGFLIGLVFFVISKNQLNVKAGLQGRLKIFMGTMVYGVVIVIINPIITYIFDGEFQYRMDEVTLMLNMCVFYFVLGFALRPPQRCSEGILGYGASGYPWGVKAFTCRLLTNKAEGIKKSVSSTHSADKPTHSSP